MNKDDWSKLIAAEKSFASQLRSQRLTKRLAVNKNQKDITTGDGVGKVMVRGEKRPINSSLLGVIPSVALTS